MPSHGLEHCAPNLASAKFEIERRSNLSYEAFAREYLYPNRPVIITDVLRHWKAIGRWTPEFFQTQFGELRFNINDSEHGQAGHDKSSGTDFTMREFIERVLISTDERPAPYYRNRDLYALFPSLKEDVQPMPDYLLPNWLDDKYLVRQVGRVLNRGAVIEIYIGGKGGTFPVLHWDGAGTHAFLMQIYGRKEYIVYPPDQDAYLYPSEEKMNLSRINSVDRPDLNQFPLFARAVPTVFVLEPGELLFVPCRWWHTAKMLTPSITLSANVLNQSNWHELVRFVCMHRKNSLLTQAARIYLAAAGARRFWRDRAWRRRLL
jgi:hypothetical protein